MFTFVDTNEGGGLGVACMHALRRNAGAIPVIVAGTGVARWRLGLRTMGKSLEKPMKAYVELGFWR